MLIAVAAMCGCSDEGVPSPASTTLEDGTTVWKIQDAPCPDGADCGAGVYINRWYYGVDCGYPAVDEQSLGAVFAVGESPPSGPVAIVNVSEARSINGESPERLALRLDCPTGERWISSPGQFDDSGLDDPPSEPTQQPPPER
jgi:hypothetical protein